jgi:predicted TIM-barrel fold metal-dependent hydrolase
MRLLNFLGRPTAARVDSAEDPDRRHAMTYPSRCLTALLSLLLCPLALHAADPADAATVYKTSYRVINVHRHCGLASEEAVRAELEVLDQVGMHAFTTLDAGSPDDNVAAWIKLREKYPGRVIVFFKLDVRCADRPGYFRDAVRNLERAARLRVQGVKVWKDLGMYARDDVGKLLKADDPRLDPFWAKCGELRLPVLIHTADEKEYWQPLTYNSFHYGLRADEDQHYQNRDMPPWEELIRQRDAVLQKHPKTSFIGAHMGSQSMALQQLGETFAKYPNFSVDTAARQRILGRLNPNAVYDFFLKYQDRILFGSDDLILGQGRKKPAPTRNITLYPCEDPDTLYVDTKDAAAVRRWQARAAFDYAQYLQYFETDRLDLCDPNRSGGSWLRIPGIKLPREVLEKVYHANAEKLIPGLERKQD